MVLLTPTLGSRDYFLLKSPSIPDDRLLHQNVPKMLFNVLPRHLCPQPLQIPHPYYILMDNYLYLPFLHAIPLILWLQGAPNCSRLFRESFGFTALQFLPNEYPLRIIPRTYRVSVLPPFFRWFTRYIEILSDLPVILCPLFLCKYLSPCIMIAFHMTSNIQ